MPSVRDHGFTPLVLHGPPLQLDALCNLTRNPSLNGEGFKIRLRHPIHAFVKKVIQLAMGGNTENGDQVISHDSSYEIQKPPLQFSNNKIQIQNHSHIHSPPLIASHATNKPTKVDTIRVLQNNHSPCEKKAYGVELGGFCSSNSLPSTTKELDVLYLEKRNKLGYLKRRRHNHHLHNEINRGSARIVWAQRVDTSRHLRWRRLQLPGVQIGQETSKCLTTHLTSAGQQFLQTIPWSNTALLPNIPKKPMENPTPSSQTDHLKIIGIWVGSVWTFGVSCLVGEDDVKLMDDDDDDDDGSKELVISQILNNKIPIQVSELPKFDHMNG
ncbi:hypothetical protein DM860_007865 [Cuscuta australis]|uniref:Uncharacterized protein n=1 Tax=Cuscuta australis TaxID=267555 RepID=A0A328E166_9ASTE|nr:hypothetical protein DM860_007865 [Cuscuta australis]